MRRFAAVLLLLLTFGSFMSAPLFAFSSNRQGNLPICCRNNGQHHCMASMGMDQESDSPTVNISAPIEKCPMFPKAILTGTATRHLCTLPSSGTFYAALRSHPACAPQTEARYRISFLRARQKRGPPAVLPS
jgi:hypothetical protein